MLSVENRIAVAGRLSTITGGLGDREVFCQSVPSCGFQGRAAFSLSVPNSDVVDFFVKEVMPDELILECCKRMPNIGKLASMYTPPIDQVGAAGSTLASLVRCHLP
jgi:hypothetical protein